MLHFKPLYQSNVPSPASHSQGTIDLGRSLSAGFCCPLFLLRVMYSNLKPGSRAGRNGGGILNCEMSPRGGLPGSPNHPAVHEISENMGWKREGASRRRELILMAFLPLPYLPPSAKLLPYIDLVNVAVDMAILYILYIAFLAGQWLHS